MKENITKAEKLYHLLFEVCNKKENRHEFAGGAYEAILSVTLIMKDNKYRDIREIVNPNEIKTFFILNQSTNKKIVLLAKDIKSSSYRHGELRVNRYSIVVNEIAKANYLRRKKEEKWADSLDEDYEEEDY